MQLDGLCAKTFDNVLWIKVMQVTSTSISFLLPPKKLPQTYVPSSISEAQYGKVVRQIPLILSL